MPKALTPAEQQARIERPTKLLKQCPRCRVVKTWKAFNRTAWRLATYSSRAIGSTRRGAGNLKRNNELDLWCNLVSTSS